MSSSDQIADVGKFHEIEGPVGGCKAGRARRRNKQRALETLDAMQLASRSLIVSRTRTSRWLEAYIRLAIQRPYITRYHLAMDLTTTSFASGLCRPFSACGASQLLGSQTRLTDASSRRQRVDGRSIIRLVTFSEFILLGHGLACFRMLAARALWSSCSAASSQSNSGCGQGEYHGSSRGRKREQLYTRIRSEALHCE